MMKEYERHLMDPIAAATDKPTAATSCAVRWSIYRTKQDQQLKKELLNVWEGEGGRSAPLHDDARGFGVFVDSRFTS